MRMFRRLIVVAIAAVCAAPVVGLLKSPTSATAKAAVAAPATSIASVAVLPTENFSASSFSALLAADAVTASFAGAPFYYFGDVNADGVVDLFDFVTLKSNLGITNGTRSQGDLTGDGIVGLDDFAILKFWFGAKSPFLP